MNAADARDAARWRYLRPLLFLFQNEHGAVLSLPEESEGVDVPKTRAATVESAVDEAIRRQRVKAESLHVARPLDRHEARPVVDRRRGPRSPEHRARISAAIRMAASCPWRPVVERIIVDGQVRREVLECGHEIATFPRYLPNRVVKRRRCYECRGLLNPTESAP